MNNNSKIIKIDEVTAEVLNKLTNVLYPKYNNDKVRDILKTLSIIYMTYPEVYDKFYMPSVTINPDYKLCYSINTDKDYSLYSLLEAKTKILDIINLETGVICKKVGQSQLEFYIKENTPLTYFNDVEEIYI